MRKHGEIVSPKTLEMRRVCSLAFALLLVVLEASTSSLSSPTEDLFLQTASNRFSEATPEELLEIWHTDCHRRCQYQLGSHIDLACRYDPYRGKRSADPEMVNGLLLKMLQPRTNDSHTFHSDNNSTKVRPDTSTEEPPFLSKDSAFSFMPYPVRSPAANKAVIRRKKRQVNIMMECCFNKACAWEEYGEYCQGHPRNQRTRDNLCSYK